MHSSLQPFLGMSLSSPVVVPPGRCPPPPPLVVDEVQERTWCARSNHRAKKGLDIPKQLHQNLFAFVVLIGVQVLLCIVNLVGRG